MAILIDGYNLLHASGVFPASSASPTLEACRSALVDFLCRMLPADELERTIIVFDARQAPPGLPRQRERGGVTMLFAPRHQSADEQLVELIQRESAPRRLTVVSSDHQVQRAARRRKARAVDSDVWCAELLRQGRTPNPPPDAKPDGPLTDGEVAFWVERFRQ